jgi:hypothetical protein
VIRSNEERFGNPYGPPDLLARRPESERAAICQALAERVYEDTQQLLAGAGAGPPSDYGGFPVRRTATGSWEETPTVIFEEPASQPNSTDSFESDAKTFERFPKCRIARDSRIRPQNRSQITVHATRVCTQLIHCIPLKIILKKLC